MVKKYTNIFLLSELCRFYIEFNRSPTAKDLDNNKDYPSISVYNNHFGHYKNAFKLCGLPIKHVRTKEEQILHKKEYRKQWYLDNPTYNTEYNKCHLDIKRKRDAKYRLLHKYDRMLYVKNNSNKFKAYSAKRKRNFGFNILNKPFENSHAHHLHINNTDDVIFIPADLHQSIWHSYYDVRKMSYINSVVLNWWLDTQFSSASKIEINIVFEAFNL
jgi:hypothetical protein